ncbi:hypothetical protein AMTR_s00612p00008240 [Amborella trichopoda]|uniref:Uncharacterized protein n=1 Tax=Amborella trichopoda TaxID=13333 RepID=W1NPT9_AMBTC|nr:hypothetical protein AMTR_s00612p00008240 [Amborella trichopoda]
MKFNISIVFKALKGLESLPLVLANVILRENAPELMNIILDNCENFANTVIVSLNEKPMHS